MMPAEEYLDYILVVCPNPVCEGEFFINPEYSKKEYLGGVYTKKETYLQITCPYCGFKYMLAH